MSEVYKIVKGRGAGGFMNPPGDPAHTYAIETYSSNRRNARQTGIQAITSEDPWIPAHIRRRAQQIIEAAEPVASDLWVRNVYGYFRHMWTADGAMWSNVANLVSKRPPDAPDDWHAAVVFIRQWFPVYQARADLIANPGKGYGSHPCNRCGRRVQYEARVDALADIGAPTQIAAVECTNGGAHEVR